VAAEGGDVAAGDLAPHARYLEGLDVAELRFQRCDDCRAAVFPPRVLCDRCGSTTLHVEVSAGLGTVYSATAVTQRDGPSYSVCLVDLDEGFRMMSAVVDAMAEDVAIGARVSARFESVADDPLGQTARVVFAPAPSR
jgi:uncharacterized OB-fold protein